MAARSNLPYFAPAEVLPAPLPTVAEILASTTRLSAPYENPVFRVGDHFAVKFGSGANLQEGENQLFVQQSTSIPVPKVYALFYDEATKTNFIVQEYIPGKSLERVCGKLGIPDKQAIATQLRRNLDELRSYPHPDPAISGPQETEEQWLPLIRRHYHAIFRGHNPVFTHANFFPGNLILREDGTVVIIDWEHAWWYPSFWEYCSAMLILKYYDDWGQWLAEMMDEYHSELRWMVCHKQMLMFNT
ncbi:kinase-like domain-containing protein [Parachaetomium inaequale]|uniref:Kinase-like domain-containing protein n=1 Tax=Parachaetomium inaequale TaxID=2588326 RepID=A0AAN6SSM8_9PEZI|nr:kinase-like domain-containing protein [Parachaetomium inaequale]